MVTKLKDDKFWKAPFLFSAVVAVIGILGEAFILHNALVHSYPFKMMDRPPAEF